MATSAESPAIEKPSALDFTRSRLKITPETPELEALLIQLARMRAKRYYIQVILQLSGLGRLQPFTAIWGFEPEREILTLGQTMIVGQAWAHTDFNKRELEAL